MRNLNKELKAFQSFKANYEFKPLQIKQKKDGLLNP